LWQSRAEKKGGKERISDRPNLHERAKGTEDQAPGFSWGSAHKASAVTSRRVEGRSADVFSKAHHYGWGGRGRGPGLNNHTLSGEGGKAFFFGRVHWRSRGEKKGEGKHEPFKEILMLVWHGTKLPPPAPRLLAA